MILTERTINIIDHESIMDSPVVLYRGDKNVELKLNIKSSRFKFRDDDSLNFIESAQASYGQLIIQTPNQNEPIFSEITATKKGYIIFVITAEMIDEIDEVGAYTFQVRLLDSNKRSRATIPPVVNGIEIREPITSEDSNVLNSAVVGLASAANEEVLDTFDEHGDYAKTNWKFGDKITDAKLNKAEDGIYQSYALGLNNSSQIKEKVNREEAGVITNVMLSQEVKEAMTGGSVAVVGKDTILTENIVDGQVTKDKINLTNNQKITSNLVIVGDTLINWDGTIAYENAEPYNRHKMLKHYPVNKNQILKFKNNVEGAYDTAYKYMFYDENKNFISGSGMLIRDVANLTATSSPVSYKDSYVIINMAEALTKYPNAKYICITFLKDEEVEIYDIGKSKIEWLDLNGNEEFEELKRKVDNPQKTYEKPFVIFSFDWYGGIYNERYRIMKKEYGYNATFCLDGQTPNYELDNFLTRQQFNEMIENGWDYAPYGGVGDRGTTEESWTNYIKGIIDQKENIGIFNPVMYNAPDNNNSDAVTCAVKNNGLKLHRCFTDDNLLKSPTQFKTGANYLTSTTLESLKNQIDVAIENNYGLVIYTHMVIEDGDTPNDGQDSPQGHCYEWAFRDILDYIQVKVNSGVLEVLTASEYYNKYNNTDSVEYDKNRETKRFNYLCKKLNLS